MLKKINKVWGWDQEFCNFDNARFHHCRINKGGTSSLHRHKADNFFYLVSGRLELSNDKGERRILEALQSVLIPGGHWHQFKALEDCDLIEAYHSANGPLVPNDIERRE